MVSTVMSCTAAENTPTVTACSAPAASPRREGSEEACSLSLALMSYLLSYSRNVSLARRSVR